MERINLNVPADVRAQIRALARASRTSEAEMARALVGEALQARERHAHAEAVMRAQTPALHARKLAIAQEMESLRSDPAAPASRRARAAG